MHGYNIGILYVVKFMKASLKNLWYVFSSERLYMNREASRIYNLKFVDTQSSLFVQHIC
jgi:hypothetical protein